MDELRELMRVERDEARAEQASTAAETAEAAYHKELAALREQLDDLILQAGLDHSDLQHQVVQPLPQGRQPLAIFPGSRLCRCRLSLQPSHVPLDLLQFPQCSFHSSPFLP